MTSRSPHLRPARVLLHPLWVLTLALLLLNDHVFKGADVIPAVLTGKLSDLVGMFVAPPVLAMLLRVRERRGLVACHVAVGVGFAAINLSPALARAVETLTAALAVPWRIWSDPTDLIALPLLLVSHRFASRVAARDRLEEIRTQWRIYSERGVFALALLGCIATSRLPPPRVSASAGQVFVPLAFDHERLAVIDAASGRDVARVTTKLSSWPRPALVDGVIIGWDDSDMVDHLVGVDVARGTTRWSIDGGSRLMTHPMLAWQSQVIVARRVGMGVNSGALSSWDARDGRHLWDVLLDEPNALVIHLQGDLLLVSGERRVLRIAPETGRTVWEAPVPEDVVAMTSLAGGAYVHLDDGQIVALDAADGTLRKRLDYPSRTVRSRLVFDGSLVASDRSLFLLVDDGVLVLDEQLRRRGFVVEVDWLYAEQGIVLGIHGEAITRLDGLTGASRWRYDGADFWYDTPTVAAGAVYLGGDEHVVAVDAETGRERWRWTYPEER